MQSILRSPEHPYPAGINACYEGLKWINTHARKLGGIANGIAIIGESGGALFASGLIVKMHKEYSRIKIRAMVLINPAEDLRTPAKEYMGWLPSGIFMAQRLTILLIRLLHNLI